MKKTRKTKYRRAGAAPVGRKRTAAVSELKAGLSAYLARVKAGEEVVVTDRGTPIAKLVPIPASAESEDERIRRLVREGVLQPPTGKLPADFWTRPRPRDPEGLVLKALLEERESSW